MQTEEEEGGVLLGRTGWRGRSLVTKPEPQEARSVSTFQKGGGQKDPVRPPPPSLVPTAPRSQPPCSSSASLGITGGQGVTTGENSK